MAQLRREGNSQDLEERIYCCQLSCYVTSGAMSSALVLFSSFRATDTLEVCRSRGVMWYSIKVHNLNLQVGCGSSKGCMRPMSKDMSVTSGQSSHRRKCHSRRMGHRWPRFSLQHFKEQGIRWTSGFKSTNVYRAPTIQQPHVLSHVTRFHSYKERKQKQQQQNTKQKNTY